MLTPGVRGNAGCYRAFTVKAPEGSILNCDKPLAVNLRTRTGWYIAPNIFRALAKAAPEQVQAFTGLPVAVKRLWPRRGRRTSIPTSLHGRRAGRLGTHGDGKSGAAVADLGGQHLDRDVRTRVPVLVVEKAYVTDSGGAGQHRGGLGQRVRFAQAVR